jgi:hypothetical protein
LEYLAEIIAGVEHSVDLAAVFGPLLDLVEIASVSSGRELH